MNCRGDNVIVKFLQTHPTKDALATALCVIVCTCHCTVEGRLHQESALGVACEHHIAVIHVNTHLSLYFLDMAAPVIQFLEVSDIGCSLLK